MNPTLENVSLREKFLTRNYAAKLRDDAGWMPTAKIDYFTHTEDFPKTFRVGECKVIEPGKRAELQVLLFWKDDTRSEQKEIAVSAKREQNDWLIDSVGPTP
jgi:hypothetical protein